MEIDAARFVLLNLSYGGLGTGSGHAPGSLVLGSGYERFSPLPLPLGAVFDVSVPSDIAFHEMTALLRPAFTRLSISTVAFNSEISDNWSPV